MEAPFWTRKLPRSHGEGGDLYMGWVLVPLEYDGWDVDIEVRDIRLVDSDGIFRSVLDTTGCITLFARIFQDGTGDEELLVLHICTSITYFMTSCKQNILGNVEISSGLLLVTSDHILNFSA